jgi:DNA-directed RNA polymerase beta subunit
MHQVKDKIHSRFYGENNIFSNQPVSGRSRHGGLRIGEMEMDVLLTHGASSLISTVIKDSDITAAFVCKKCGYMLSSSNKCILCKSTECVQLEVPFAFKNFAHVLQMVGIKIEVEL